jgi:hypothetical protein
LHGAVAAAPATHEPIFLKEGMEFELIKTW